MTKEVPASQPSDAEDATVVDLDTVLRRHPEAHTEVEQLLDFRAATVRER